MHSSTLVDDVQEVVAESREKHGEFTLPMLYNPISLTSSSSWNLMVSARRREAHLSSTQRKGQF
jgi:hypothetical protein